MSGYEPLVLGDVLARACKEAQFEDFGTRVFIPSLAKLIEDINSAMDQLNDRGRKGVEDRMVRLLVNRLRMHRDTLEHPEILKEELLPPAAIVGLPRTGSTKLQRLLASGKGLHEMLMWQGYNPAPLPGPRETDIERRKDAAADFIASLDMFAPDSQKGHRLVVEEADEEVNLLEQSMLCPSPISFFPLYKWVRYIQRMDKTDMYEHLRLLLQYLQWQFYRGERKSWLLKFPANLGNESHMSRSFPGIRYVVTHRDPFPVMASLIRLHQGSHMLYCKEFDYKNFSSWALDEFSSEMERHLAWRVAYPDAPVLDVAFKDIVRDGMGVARNIYEFLDLKWSPATEQEIRRWLADNDKQKDKLEYNLAEIGFDEDECRARFGDYYARFSGYL